MSENEIARSSSLPGRRVLRGLHPNIAELTVRKAVSFRNLIFSTEVQSENRNLSAVLSPVDTWRRQGFAALACDREVVTNLCAVTTARGVFAAGCEGCERLRSEHD